MEELRDYEKVFAGFGVQTRHGCLRKHEGRITLTRALKIQRKKLLFISERF